MSSVTKGRALFLWAVAAGMAYGERLPIRTYTTADGLPHDSNSLHPPRLARLSLVWYPSRAGPL